MASSLTLDRTLSLIQSHCDFQQRFKTKSVEVVASWRRVEVNRKGISWNVEIPISMMSIMVSTMDFKVFMINRDSIKW